MLTSCSDSGKNISGNGYNFKQVYTLDSCNVIRLDSAFIQPMALSITDDLLAVYSLYDSPHFVNLFNVETGKKVKSFVSRGRGPGEVLMAGVNYDPHSRSVTIRDVSTKILNYAITADTSVLDYTSVDISSIFGLMVQHLQDSLFLRLNDTPDYRYSLITNNGVLKSFLHLPDDGKGATTGRAYAYQGYFVPNHDKTRFVFAASSSDLLEIYSWDGDSLRVLSSRMTYFPDYVDQSSQNSISVAFTGGNKFGFSALSFSKKYIYAGYSGRSMDSNPDDFYYINEVYVMDWDGNTICKYVLGSDVLTMCVDADDSKLYAARYASMQELNRCEFISFELPELPQSIN